MNLYIETANHAIKYMYKGLARRDFPAEMTFELSSQGNKEGIWSILNKSNRECKGTKSMTNFSNRKKVSATRVLKERNGLKMWSLFLWYIHSENENTHWLDRRNMQISFLLQERFYFFIFLRPGKQWKFWCQFSHWSALTLVITNFLTSLIILDWYEGNVDCQNKPRYRHRLAVWV